LTRIYWAEYPSLPNREEVFLRFTVPNEEHFRPSSLQPFIQRFVQCTEPRSIGRLRHTEIGLRQRSLNLVDSRLLYELDSQRPILLDPHLLVPGIAVVRGGDVIVRDLHSHVPTIYQASAHIAYPVVAGQRTETLRVQKTSVGFDEPLGTGRGVLGGPSARSPPVGTDCRAAILDDLAALVRVGGRGDWAGLVAIDIAGEDGIEGILESPGIFISALTSARGGRVTTRPHSLGL